MARSRRHAFRGNKPTEQRNVSYTHLSSAAYYFIGISLLALRLAPARLTIYTTIAYIQQ